MTDLARRLFAAPAAPPYWGAVAMVMVGGLALRLALLGGSLILGDDSGTYLATRNWVIGQDATGTGGLRPPLIGYYLVPFTAALGDVAGVKLAAVLASFMPAIPGYFIVRHLSSCRWTALAGATIVAWLPSYADPLSWGFLTLMAIAAGTSALYLLARGYEADTSRSQQYLTGAVLLGLVVVYLNQTAAPVVLLCAVIFSVVQRRLPPWWLVLLAAVLALPAIPYGSGLIGVTTGASGHDLALAGLTHKGPSSIVLLAAAAIVVIMLWSKLQRPVERVMVVMMFVAVLGNTFTAPQSEALSVLLGRAWLWAAMPIVILVLCGVRRYVRTLAVGRPVFAVGLILLALAMVIGWAPRAMTLAREYGTMTPGALNAIRWLKVNADEAAVVAAWPLGASWLVEGFANRRTISVVPAILEIRNPSRLERDAIVRCLMSEAVCDDGLPDEVAYLFVVSDGLPLAWPQVYRSGQATVYRVGIGR